jgi:hypothetical protein
MDEDRSAVPADDLDRELAQLLREEAARRERPDRRPPRGSQPPAPADVERGREGLERILGW